MSNKVLPYSLFTDFDVDLFSSGKHYRLYEKFGSHVVTHESQEGVYFAVYAPAARKVELVGEFNYWNGYEHELYVRWDGSGIWEGFVPGLKHGQMYKYRIYSNHDHAVRDKADPYAKKYETPPKTASVIWDTSYDWKDKEWMTTRSQHNDLNAPISVYELHIGSWKKQVDSGWSLSYKEMADDLVDYVKDLGFTHVEFLPVMEHPFFPSWGYLCTGYFAPSSRFGDPEEFKYLVDKLHQEGIGVILDWVPAHFPSDDFALADFDGSKVYEHPDIRKGFHPDWNSLIFNFERGQVRSFLMSSAHYWTQQFHADGLRVDAVASMIYLDYSREDGEWEPNMYGDNKYLAAIDLLKEINKSIYHEHGDVQMIAEESTSFPGVTNPVHHDGLGFGLKWMMGWMNDTLEYFERDPIHRKYHHGEISRSMIYAYTENYILPLSHDEVVHGKQSLVYKMPGDDWQKFANLRLLYIYMFTHPGHKLLFMGNEFGQTAEWNVNKSLDWHLLEYDPHKGIQALVKDLNTIYKEQKALYEFNFDPKGFQWIDYSDGENSVLAYLRKGEDSFLVVALNFSPVVRDNYRIGVPQKGVYTEILNSDNNNYWGSDQLNKYSLNSDAKPLHGFENSISLTLPPLGGTILKFTEK